MGQLAKKFAQLMLINVANQTKWITFFTVEAKIMREYLNPTSTWYFLKPFYHPYKLLQIYVTSEDLSKFSVENPLLKSNKPLHSNGAARVFPRIGRACLEKKVLSIEIFVDVDQL